MTNPIIRQQPKHTAIGQMLAYATIGLLWLGRQYADDEHRYTEIERQADI